MLSLTIIFQNITPKIEYIANDLLIQDLEEGNETDTEFPKRDSNYPNIDHLRNRGGDEKGPAFGSDNKQFSTHGKRVDAMKIVIMMTLNP
ncbi:MAG: hypothetical protein CM15mP8_1770 [Methanobacteriota archaeon]|nr:MAG: hypothetical protein CM15mP8_1770 [Euryarchaeota archaeon]